MSRGNAAGTGKVGDMTGHQYAAQNAAARPAALYSTLWIPRTVASRPLLTILVVSLQGL